MRNSIDDRLGLLRTLTIRDPNIVKVFSLSITYMAVVAWLISTDALYGAWQHPKPLLSTFQIITYLAVPYLSGVVLTNLKRGISLKCASEEMCNLNNPRELPGGQKIDLLPQLISGCLYGASSYIGFLLLMYCMN